MNATKVGLVSREGKPFVATPHIMRAMQPLEDAAASGLLNVFHTIVNDKVFGCCRAKVELTDEGWKVARRLSEHKSSGGSFSDFEL